MFCKIKQAGLASVIKVVFIGPEGALAETVRQTIKSIKGCNFQRSDLSDIEFLNKQPADSGIFLVYFSDSSSEQDNAIDFLQTTAEWDPPVPTIILSENFNPDLSLKLLQMGAEVLDCLPRPLDVSRLRFLVDLLLSRRPCQQMSLAWNAASEVESQIENRIHDFLFDSPPMQNLSEQLRAVAPLDTTILITGETGTGKTHVARVIHELSQRQSKPFLTVPCGALTSSLLESELFGHVRGAFTGADTDRVGKLAEAGDGTLLLDEIDCVPLDAQVKLLRAVEERIFEPVGSNRSESLQARLIVTANRPLDTEVAAGRFRKDLYYRFNVVPFSMPLLREQPELIPLLAAKFQADFCARNQRQAQGMSSAALEALETFDWPGNIRELRNVIERAAALCPGAVIDLADLPVPIQKCYKNPKYPKNCMSITPGNQLEWARKEGEFNRLIEVLERNGQNRTVAAEELGISRVTLYKKLHRYRLI